VPRYERAAVRGKHDHPVAAVAAPGDPARHPELLSAFRGAHHILAVLARIPDRPQEDGVPLPLGKLRDPILERIVGSWRCAFFGGGRFSGRTVPARSQPVLND
jgi:hypothetical protein